MWKHLNTGENVSVGDKIRLIGNPVNSAHEYTVVKAEQHYFQISPVSESELQQQNFLVKIVRYFEIGYYMKVEIWID